MDTLDTIPTALILLLRGYAALTPPRYLHFPSGLGFKTVHDFLFNDILNNPLFLSYPPVGQYQNKFWTWALAHLESLECPDVCD